MSFVRIAAVTLGTFFGVLVLGALLLPGEIRVERNIEISAPPDQVFPLVDDLEVFHRWSPWSSADSATVYEFSGPDAGVGARMTWSSENPEVGAGSQEIISSTPPEQVLLALDFGPQGGAEAAFDLEPTDSGTRVTWSFGYDIGYDLVGRYVGLVMQEMVGRKYEEGLERLKRFAETGDP
jgi:uncharacterized protein YndB with AHSA1/START domain